MGDNKNSKSIPVPVPEAKISPKPPVPEVPVHRQYIIAPGKSITTLSFIKVGGEDVSAKDFANGEVDLKKLIDDGYVVAK